MGPQGPPGSGGSGSGIAALTFDFSHSACHFTSDTKPTNHSQTMGSMLYVDTLHILIRDFPAELYSYLLLNNAVIRCIIHENTFGQNGTTHQILKTIDITPSVSPTPTTSFVFAHEHIFTTGVTIPQHAVVWLELGIHNPLESNICSNVSIQGTYHTFTITCTPSCDVGLLPYFKAYDQNGLVLFTFVTPTYNSNGDVIIECASSIQGSLENICDGHGTQDNGNECNACHTTTTHENENECNACHTTTTTPTTECTPCHGDDATENTGPITDTDPECSDETTTVNLGPARVIYLGTQTMLSTATANQIVYLFINALHCDPNLRVIEWNENTVTIQDRSPGLRQEGQNSFCAFVASTHTSEVGSSPAVAKNIQIVLSHTQTSQASS
jgi:hypothetical protein